MSKKYKSPNRTIRNITDFIADRCYYDIEDTIRNRLQYAPQFVKRLELDSVLEGHTGCVNCLEWTADGRILASASDDQSVFLWDPFKRKQIIDFHTPHHGNIFSVKFLPHSNDSLMATGAGDGEIYVYDINHSIDYAPIWRCKCHYSRVKRLATAPDSPHVFWSASEDGNILQLDKREKHKCHDRKKVLLIGLSNHMGPNAEAKCVAINQCRTEMLAVGANDVYARIFDRRMITVAEFNYRRREILDPLYEPNIDNISKGCVTYFAPGHLNKNKEKRLSFVNKAITYLTFSPNGNELLVNMGGEQLYLYDINNAKQPDFLTLPHFQKNFDTQPINRRAKVAPSQNSTTIEANGASTSATEPQTIVSNKSKLPKHVEAIKRLGNDYLEDEKYTHAIDQYTKAIGILPNHPIFYLNRATAFMRRKYYGDVYAALRDCMKALKLDPNYVKAHFRMARALFELGFVHEASDCLQDLQNRFMTNASNSGVTLLKRDIQNHLQQNKNTDDFNSLHDGNSALTANELYWRSKALDYSERFIGHCNTTTDIKEANFMGNDGRFVVAGSDGGSFFIWERPTGIITNIFKADSTIVNCVQANPQLCMLATSGIDPDIRLWCPQPENYEVKNRMEYTEASVSEMQQRMQSDPFDLNGSNAMCRSS